MIKTIREPVNSISHALGAFLALIGLGIMMNKVLFKASPLALLATLLFGISMILLYTASAVYHWVLSSDKLILKLKRVDHIMIFILIAGTYSPFCLITLPELFGWIVFSIVWLMALAGIFLKIFWIQAPRWVSTGIYLGMGWISLVIFPFMTDAFTKGGFVWLGLGGLAYTIGAIIYALKKPDPFPLRFGFHEIWHLFVMAGTFCHFCSIYYYVLPISVS